MHEKERKRERERLLKTGIFFDGKMFLVFSFKYTWTNN